MSECPTNPEDGPCSSGEICRMKEPVDSREPTQPGIAVKGRDGRGSPLDVTFHRRVRCIKDPKEYLQLPQKPGNWDGIAVSPSGTIFVTDESHNAVRVFSKGRRYVTSFGTTGIGEGQLRYPHGLTVDFDGLVYVANLSNNRIEVFREDGTYVRQIGSGHLSHPWNVAIHNQQLYIADADNHRVSVYTLQGQRVRSIGSEGKGAGQFYCPSGVAFSTDGDMYVTDYHNHCVQVFCDASGHFKRKFGQGQLKNPRDIVITRDGDVLVADEGNNRVACFSTHGNTSNLVHSFEVKNPRCLTIDNDGNILVTEYQWQQSSCYILISSSQW